MGRWQVWRTRATVERQWIAWDGVDAFATVRFDTWREAYDFADRMARSS